MSCDSVACTGMARPLLGLERPRWLHQSAHLVPPLLGGAGQLVDGRVSVSPGGLSCASLGFLKHDGLKVCRLLTQ